MRQMLCLTLNMREREFWGIGELGTSLGLINVNVIKGVRCEMHSCFGDSNFANYM
jgi:hypothetical protein